MQLPGLSAQNRKIITLALAMAMMSGVAGCTVVARDRPSPPYAPGYQESDYIEYYYYPSVGVYYQFTTGYYYYYSNRRWIRTRFLPSHIHLHRDDRVRLRLRDREPYLHHDEHRRLYRPNRRYRSDERYDRDEREFNQREYRRCIQSSACCIAKAGFYNPCTGRYYQQS